MKKLERMKNRYIALLLLAIGNLALCAEQTLSVNADDCCRMAVESSRKLAGHQLAKRQAELDVKIADISRLPNVQGMASGMYMVPDMEMMGMKVEMRGAYMEGLQITQPIYA